MNEIWKYILYKYISDIKREYSGFIFRFITQISKKDQNANTIKLSFSIKVNDHYMLENTSIHWIGVGSHAGSNMLGVTQDFIQIFKVKYDII
jgi:hypothetical protein